MKMTNLNDRKVMTMLAHEKEILRRTQHPNILKLYECITTPDRVYMVSELMKGDLFELTIGKRRKLNEVQTAQVMSQLFSAVEYLHSINVVHRDIKLENILANDWNDIRLADMGLAKIIRESNPNADIKSTPCGTSIYIAPEVISAIDSGYGGITALVTTSEKLKLLDLWSCGVTMYVLLSGRPPFSGQVKTAQERRDLLARVDRGLMFPDAHWSHISEDAKDLISGLLARDENSRMTARTAQQHPWFALQKSRLEEFLATQEKQKKEEEEKAKQQQQAEEEERQKKQAADQQEEEEGKEQGAVAEAGDGVGANDEQQKQKEGGGGAAADADAAAVDAAAVDPSEEDVRNNMNALAEGLREDAEAETEKTGDRADVQVVTGHVPQQTGGMARGAPSRRGGKK